MEKQKPMVSLSIVVPVYNSELSLTELVQRLLRVLQTMTDNYELILVNDCSRDQSWDVICRLAQENDFVYGIDLMRNYGQHNALLCGIRAARHEIIVTMDDDLQHPPEEIPKLINKLAEGYDVVYGTPKTGEHGLWRNLASKATKLALRRAMGAETASSVSAFRAFCVWVRDAFHNYPGPFVSIDVLLTWGAKRFATVQVQHDSRRFGSSNYTFSKLVTHALNMMTGFSTWPLQVASLIGFALALFGIGVLVYVVARYLIYGGAPAGFPFIASIIAIFSGAQLFALGIIGEYLSRMHFRMMGRPAYFIRRQVHRDREPR